VEQPTIAIIVPILNEGERLPQLLQMLEALHADEVIIVDGGSTDGSDQLLSESSIHWIKSNPGRAIQMNNGAVLCRSDILLFLHADTEITQAALIHVRDAMENPSIVGGRFDVTLSGAHPAFRLIEFMMNLRSRLTKISTGDQTIFVRREVFESLGGFPDQPLMEDIEFSKHLKGAGRIACLRDKVITSSRRWEKHGVMNTIVLMWKLRFFYWRGVSPDVLVKMYHHAR
jgi:rSAM/selenodomain-associated transferase 2